MIFNDVVDWYAQLDEVIDSLGEFKESLLSINKKYDELSHYIISANASNAIVSTNWLNHQSVVKSRLNDIKVETQKINLMTIGRILTKLETKVEVNSELHNPVSCLIESIEDCSKFIHEFNNTKSEIELSNKLKILIEKIKNTIDIIDNVKFISQYLIKINEYVQLNYSNNEVSTLSIRIYDEIFTAQDINEHMELVIDMYERVCAIFNVSIAQYPLIPVKIETGSILNKLLGHEKVMEFLGDLLNRSIGFIYRNYTKEGKIEGNKNKLEAIKEHIELIDLCEKHGINMDEAKDIIEQNVNVICNDLYKLTTSSSKIAVNGNIYDLGKEASNAIIESHKIKYLDISGKNEDNILDEVAPTEL